MEMQIADIPRLYTGLAEWFFCFMYVMMIRPGRKDARQILLMVLSLIVQCAFLVFTADVAIWLWIPCMAAAFLLMCLFMRFQLNAGFQKAFYYGAKSFLYAEFAASLVWQLETYFRGQNPAMMNGASVLLLVIVYGLTGLILWLLEHKTIDATFREPLLVWENFSVPGTVLLVFIFSNLNHITGTSPFSAGTAFGNFIFRTLIDGFGIVLVYAYELHLRDLRILYSQEQMQNILRYQYESYRNYRDSMEYVHVLRHDLKHQVIGLKGERDEKKRSEWIDTMIEELKSLDTAPPTDNSVLDSIIGAKYPLIRKNGISFTCVADGKLIDFMHVVDICTLFGNALDNAIESSVLVSDPEKRMIHFSLSARKQFVFVQFSNYYEQEIRKDDQDVIITTKNDTVSHGYGIRAMRYVTEKYGGSLSIRTENNRFELNILLPIPRT